jgi:hypothetical protein
MSAKAASRVWARPLCAVMVVSGGFAGYDLVRG